MIISAFTDAIITAGTSLTAAMMASGAAQMPNDAALVLVLVGSLVTFSRTIQQGIKATPQNTAELKGEEFPPPKEPIVAVVQEQITKPGEVAPSVTSPYAVAAGPGPVRAPKLDVPPGSMVTELSQVVEPKKN